MSATRFTVLAVSIALLSSGCSTLVQRDKKPDSGPQMSEQAYYQDAQKSLKGHQYDDAVRTLEALETYYPVGSYTEQAQLDLMYSRFRQSDYEGAISAAERFMRLYPNNSQLDYVHYLRAVANMESGFDGLLRYTNLHQSHRDVSFLRLSYQQFNELLQRFPNSRFAADARYRLRYIVNQFAESEMNVARFQLKRQAWVAAAQRARWVLDYYPQTPQIPEALATLVYSYQQLGMNDLAQQSLDLLKLNYPQLVDGDQVRLQAARRQASWLNRMTLGILGQRADVNDAWGTPQTPPAPAPSTTPRS